MEIINRIKINYKLNKNNCLVRLASDKKKIQMAAEAEMKTRKNSNGSRS